MGRNYVFSAAPACVFVLCGGCLLGPDYTSPANQEGFPAEFSERVDDVGSTSLDKAWWESFGDPVLERLVNEGAGSNLSVRQAYSRVVQARLAVAETGADLWPSLDASASVSRTERRHAGTPSDTMYGASLDAGWEPDLFGGLRRGLEVSLAEYEAAGYSLADARLSVCSEIASGYIELRRLQEEYVIACSNLQISVEMHNIEKSRSAAGMSTAMDENAAMAQVLSAEAQLPELESQIKVRQYALEVLTGRYPGELADVLSVAAPVPVPKVIPETVPSEMLRRRPDIRIAEAGLHAAVASIGVAEADRFPRLTITGNLGASADSLSSWSAIPKTFGFGPALSVPLFYGGRLKTRVRMAEEAAEEASLAYTEKVVSAVSEVESALCSLGMERGRGRLLEEALGYSQRAMNASFLLYENGECEYSDVLGRVQTYLSAQQSVLDNRASISTQAVALYKAVGGLALPDDAAGVPENGTPGESGQGNAEADEST